MRVPEDIQMFREYLDEAVKSFVLASSGEEKLCPRVQIDVVRCSHITAGRRRLRLRKRRILVQRSYSLGGSVMITTALSRCRRFGEEKLMQAFERQIAGLREGFGSSPGYWSGK